MNIYIHSECLVKGDVKPSRETFTPSRETFTRGSEGFTPPLVTCLGDKSGMSEVYLSFSFGTHVTDKRYLNTKIYYGSPTKNQYKVLITSKSHFVRAIERI